MTPSFDPLATSKLIVDSYRRYLKSLLPVRDARLAAALDEELRLMADWLGLETVVKGKER